MGMKFHSAKMIDVFVARANVHMNQANGTEAYWGHSIYEYIFSISGKICVISISEKNIFLNSEKKNNFVFWKNIMLNLRKM